MGIKEIIYILKTFGPEIISLIKWLHDQIESGIEEHHLKKQLEELHGAIHDEDRRNAAARINRIFRGE